MTIRKWTRLFWTTLVWGIGSAVAAGFLLQLTDQQFTFLGATQVGYNLFTMILGGAIISVLCQMGFFSYLIMRMILLGMIRNKKIWDLLQIFLVVLTLYELASLRYLYFADGKPFIQFFDLPVLVLIVSLIFSFWKMKLTNVNAFIPTLFFLTFVSVLEAVPALKLNNWPSTFFMLVPTFCCNAWQIFILPKILADKKGAVPKAVEND